MLWDIMRLENVLHSWELRRTGCTCQERVATKGTHTIANLIGVATLAGPSRCMLASRDLGVRFVVRPGMQLFRTARRMTCMHVQQNLLNLIQLRQGSCIATRSARTYEKATIHEAEIEMESTYEACVFEAWCGAKIQRRLCCQYVSVKWDTVQQAMWYTQPAPRSQPPVSQTIAESNLRVGYAPCFILHVINADKYCEEITYT